MAAAVLIYARTLGYDFLDFDDPLYLTQNLKIVDGLTWETLRWAFTGATALSYWHPVTWVSWLADVTLFGSWPGGYHAVNALLHVLNVALAFTLLLRLTGEKWCAAFAAFVFAVHPMHQESVVWITERKDVLALFWGLLALHAYLRWVSGRRGRTLALFLIFYALSLMSKPVLVVLPLLLLLLDYWPLRRFDPYALWDAARSQGIGTLRKSPLPALLLEKLPAFGLAALSAIVTALTLPPGLDLLPLEASQRLGNAFVSYLVYFLKIFIPVDLGILYPFPAHQPLRQVAGSVVALLAAAVLAIRFGRRLPWLLVGAAWFVLGFVTIIVTPKYGMHVAVADRWAYFPYLGAYLALAMGGGEALRALVADARRRHLILAAGGGLFCLWLMALALSFIGYWRDSLTIYKRTLDVTQDNYVIENNYGRLLLKQKDYAGAETHFKRSLAVQPDSPMTQGNLGNLYLAIGRYGEAIGLFQRELKLDPDGPNTVDDFYAIGYCLAQLKRFDEAEIWYRKTLDRRPDHPEANNDLGNIAWLRGDFAAAAGFYAKAVQSKPDYPVAQQNLLRARARLAAQ